MIFQSSNIRNSEGVKILFRLEKKIGVLASIFTTGHNHVQLHSASYISESDFGVPKSS
jgi:uncharacterized protein (DUF1499 family)